MSEVILSLVVKIYGVELYLRRFLDSLEKNLRPGVEVILVDDGSKDNSGKIIDEFATKKYPPDVSVVAIHKLNGGVSSASNAGMAIAKGKYITFPDPDDYFSEDYIESIFETINKYNYPDLIIFDYAEDIDGKIKECRKQYRSEGFIQKEKFIRLLAQDKNINSHLTNKVLKQKLVKDLQFKENIRVLEDFDFFTEIIMKINTVYYLKKLLYFVTIRKDSLTKTMNIEDYKKSFEIAKYRYKILSNYYPQISIFPMVLWAHKILQLNYKNKISIDVSEYEDFIKKNINIILKEKSISLNEKKQCLFVCIGISKIYYLLKNK